MKQFLIKIARKSPLVILSIISLIPLGLLIYGYMHQSDFVTSQEQVRRMVESYGVWAPLAFVAIQIIQIIITPINHYSVGLAGGFIFGPVYGTFLNLVGRIIGHTAAFTISRYLARPVLKWLLPNRSLAKYDKYVGGSGFYLFMAYWLPFFPDDELSYIAGSSRMPWDRFMLANIFGQFGGGVALAYAGAGVGLDFFAYVAIFGSLIAGCLCFWLIRKRDKVKQEMSAQPQ
jgi:uncharacterized membrane protein YdjX (TVP38/TMEM64 family)